MKNLKDLPREEQLDILARAYLVEKAKEVNKRLSGIVYHISYGDVALANGQIKNQFLCGTNNILDAGYSLDKSGRYELENFSTVGALFNYLYRTAVLGNLENNYDIGRATACAYSEVRAAGYTPFWEYYNYAWREMSPISVKGLERYTYRPKAQGLSLSEVRKRSIASLDEFEEIRGHIKTEILRYMRAQGCDQGTIDSMMDIVARLPQPEIKIKSKTKVTPAKNVKGKTIISLPTEEDKTRSMADGIDKGDEFEQENILEDAKSASLAGKLKPTGMIDAKGVAIGLGADGNYYYPDGSRFTDTKTYWEDSRGVAVDTEAGLVYDDTREEDEDEEEQLAFYDDEGYMISDGGMSITLENGYSDADVEETRKTKSKDPNQMTIDDLGKVQ